MWPVCRFSLLRACSTVYSPALLRKDVLGHLRNYFLYDSFECRVIARSGACTCAFFPAPVLVWNLLVIRRVSVRLLEMLPQSLPGLHPSLSLGWRTRLPRDSATALLPCSLTRTCSPATRIEHLLCSAQPSSSCAACAPAGERNNVEVKMPQTKVYM